MQAPDDVQQEDVPSKREFLIIMATFFLLINSWKPVFRPVKEIHDTAKEFHNTVVQLSKETSGPGSKILSDAFMAFTGKLVSGKPQNG